MDYRQLTFLLAEKEEIESKREEKNTICSKEKKQGISERLKKEFDIMEVPFLGCDFENIYPKLAEIMPQEHVFFDFWGTDVLIMSEIVCAGICHQMNWDYLRGALFEKVQESPDWILPNNLIKIEEKEVSELFFSYNKPERVRAKERMKILRAIGKWAESFKDVSSIFFNKGVLLPKDVIRNNLLQCDIFAMDPEEKKMQLLLQKLSSYKSFKGLTSFCQPAIDYHLIRSYLRRGLLFGKTGHAKEYISNIEIERKESTVGAVRHLCAELMLNICECTGLDVNTINQIEWHIGRSVCLQEKPDCDLVGEESRWLRSEFKSCPFSNTCEAKCGNLKFMEMKEPTYKGSSY